MIIATTRYELLMFYRNRKIWLALMSLVFLVLLTGASSAITHFSSHQEKQKIAQIERERWLQQDEKDPHSAAHYSIYAFKSASPLVVLDSGVESFVGQAVWLEAHKQNDMLYRPQGDALLLERAGSLSPSMLLLEIVPLFAFWLVFTAIAQQKERGTLRFVLSSAIEPGKFIFAKWLAVWLLLFCFMVVPLMLLGIASAAALQQITADSILRTLLWGGAMAMYFAIVIALAMAITLMIRHVRTALVLLIALWIFFALVIPRWASAIIDSSMALPSTQAIKEQLEKEAPAYWTAEQGEVHKEKILTQYGVGKLEDLPVNYRGALLNLAERHSQHVYDRVLGDFYQRVGEQDKMFSLLSMLSPTIALQRLLPAIAGSDFSHHHHFIMAAENYRRALVNRMNAEVMNHKVVANEKHTEGAALWAQIPEFSYVSPPFSRLPSQLTPAFLIILGWLAGAIFLLRLACRRLPL